MMKKNLSVFYISEHQGQRVNTNNSVAIVVVSGATVIELFYAMPQNLAAVSQTNRRCLISSPGGNETMMQFLSILT